MMHINKIGQPTLENIKQTEYDLIVCASGYESRASHLASQLKSKNSRRIVFGFEEHSNTPTRKVNDARFSELEFEPRMLSEKDSLEAKREYLELLSLLGDRESKILIDISSMTRAWYGGFVQALWTARDLKTITTTFAYVPAAYSRPPNYPPNEVVKPVLGFRGLEPANKPTALVIGLGQDPDRALGIKEELDPALTVLFHANPGTDRRYDKAVASANKGLFELVPQEYQLPYPIQDTTFTFAILESLCRGLLRDFRVVLTSFGPKIFGLICFLMAARYEGISVWRVSAGSRNIVIDHRPGKSVISIEATWSEAGDKP